LCEVRVFQFWVEQQLDDWPERNQRETQWFDVPRAAALVDEGGLAEVMRSAFAPIRTRRLYRLARARVTRSLLPQQLR
jgi:hypothetical protein